MKLYADVRITRRVRKHGVFTEEDEPTAWFETIGEALEWLALMGHQEIDFYPGPIYGPYKLNLTETSLPATMPTADRDRSNQRSEPYG